MKRPIFLIIVILLLLGIPYLNYNYKKFYNEVQEEIKIEAVVISNKKNGEYYNSYIIRGKNGIFKNKKFISYTKENLEYGDNVIINGEFHEPDCQRNYKGFSYKNYLKTQKIYGTVKAKNVSVVSKNSLNIIFLFANSVRNKIIEKIETFLPKETSGLFIGILLGDKTKIEDDIVTSFQKSSLAHILAVSGTHVSYIILFISYINSVNKTNKKCGYFIIILVLIAFMFITNFSLSVIRACIMTIVVIVSKLLHKKADVINTILIALLITIIYNPYCVKSVSLQLSYLGTIGVIYISPIIKNSLKKIIMDKKVLNLISVSLSAQLAILPIMIVNFHTISFTFLLTNFLAIPLLGVTIILGLMAIPVSFISIWFASKIGLLLNLILKLLILTSKIFSSFEYSNIYVTTPRIITIFIYYSVLFIIIYVYNIKKVKYPNNYQLKILHFCDRQNITKILVIMIVVIVLLEFPYLKYNGKLKIFFIDVGQRRQHINN